jgi:hypothetical protein
MQSKLAWNWKSSCLSLLSARIARTYYHARHKAILLKNKFVALKKIYRAEGLA